MRNDSRTFILGLRCGPTSVLSEKTYTMQMKITHMSENQQSCLNSINQCFIVNTRQHSCISREWSFCCSWFITQGTECSLLGFGGWYFGNEPIYFLSWIFVILLSNSVENQQHSGDPILTATCSHFHACVKEWEIRLSCFSIMLLSQPQVLCWLPRGAAWDISIDKYFSPHINIK